MQGPVAPNPPEVQEPAAPGAAPETQASPPVGSHAAPSGITVSSLGEIEGPPTGTLDTPPGGLGMDLWFGSARATVEELMAQLPLATTIAPIRSLARRIVLTKAAAPDGDADRAFMTVRIQSLLDAGLLTDAANLASLAEIRNDAGFARVQAEAMLFAGQDARLCDDTTSTRLDSSEPFWVELRAYCYAVSGDADALGLTRAVMQAQNIDDGAFETLLDDVQNHVAKDPGSIDAPTALDAFLLQKIGVGVDYDTGVQLGTPGLVLAFRNTQNDPADRMRAGDRLVSTGALSADELVAIADAQHFTKDQFATEHAQIGILSFLAGQALLRQAVLRASPDAQPALVYEALSGAQAKGLVGIAAVLQQQALIKLQPNPGLHEMAGPFARALMMTGHGDDAARWLALLDPKLDSDRHLAAGLAVTLNLVASDPARQASAKAALDELAGDIEDKTPGGAYAALALGLSVALGQPLGEAAQKAEAAAKGQHWPGRVPAASIMARLKAAADAPGKRGEALMLALNAIGPKGPGDMAPDAVADLVRTLEKLGVPDSARELAVTALLRYRPPSPPPPAASISQ
jgi:hypothetical protein